MLSRNALVIEENPLVLIAHEIITGQTICRPFRENSTLSPILDNEVSFHRSEF
jgi:hypothetical protein